MGHQLDVIIRQGKGLKGLKSNDEQRLVYLDKKRVWKWNVF